jgi:phage-related protein
MKCKNHLVHYGFILLTCGGLVCGVAPTGAQSQTQALAPQAQDRDENITRRQLSGFDNFLDSHPEVAEQLRKDPSLVNNQEFVERHGDLQQYLQQHPEVREELGQNPNGFMRQEQRFDRREDQARDRDVTRGELANMDRFIDSHPEIGEQLRRDPSLVNDKKFVGNHPALQQFLAEHPGVREEYKENPNAFMNQEQRFDQRQDQPRGDRDVTRGELANMDRFMDSHPEIAEQLRKNPSLVDDKQFEKNHPALQQFLAEHPGVREECKENPNAFMNQEQRFDQRQDQPRGDRDVTRGELANMDRFMDSHPEIAEQLRKNPSLVDDKQFEKNHPALQQFLAEHPGVREEYKENPNAFMHQEQRFDQRQDSAMHRDRDLSRGELSNFSEFLEGHNNIAGELSKNPSLANNKEYLENHPALRDYLKAHPQVHQELSENPQTFLQSTQQFNTHSTAKVGESKPK